MLGRGTLERERESRECLVIHLIGRSWRSLLIGDGRARFGPLLDRGGQSLMRRSFLSNNNTKPNQTEAINAVGLAAAS